MATFTPNLNLEQQGGGERASLVVLNANLGKIDEFAGKAQGTVITNEYSTVLSAINALRTSKTFPFTIQKAGSSSFSDLPSGVSSTCEWTVVCSGSSERVTAILTIYTGGSSMNGWSWTANIYNGSYILDWISLSSKTIYNGTANGDYISALEGKVVKNGSFVSGYFVLTANADFSAANLTLISNLPSAYNQDVQLSCTGLSGTNIYKASRVRITTSGTITTWYGFGFKSGESYLICVNYICA